MILNYNEKKALRECLMTLPPCTAIVVDNDSVDGSADMVTSEFPGVVVIRRSQNNGIAGYNDGIKYALALGSEYVFVATNDVTFTDAAIFDRLIRKFEVERARNPGIIAPDQLFPDGSRKSTGGSVGRLRLTIGPSRGEVLDYAWNCMIRKEVFEAIGFIDSSYFMYWEDVDFGTRARKAGFSVLASHESCLNHAGSISADKVKGLKGYVRLRNKLIYSSRNRSRPRRVFDSLVVTSEVPFQLLSRRKYGDMKLTLVGYFHGIEIMLGLKSPDERTWTSLQRSQANSIGASS